MAIDVGGGGGGGGGLEKALAEAGLAALLAAGRVSEWLAFCQSDFPSAADNGEADWWLVALICRNGSN